MSIALHRFSLKDAVMKYFQEIFYLSKSKVLKESFSALKKIKYTVFVMTQAVREIEDCERSEGREGSLG